jgi:tRNA(His) 5'-end guanylyltransferase
MISAIYNYLFGSKKDVSSLHDRMEANISNWNKMNSSAPSFVISLKSKSLLKYLKKETDFTKKNEELGQNNISLKKVCKMLYDKYDPVLIYCFNNEINLAFTTDDNTLYNGNISKFVCKIASHASVWFTKELNQRGVDIDIVFEGIFAEFSKCCELLNYLIWRQFDCRRNTVTSLYKSFIKNGTVDNVAVHHMADCFNVPKDLMYGIIMKKGMFVFTKGNENHMLVRNKIVAEHFYLADNFDKVLDKYIKTKFLV